MTTELQPQDVVTSEQAIEVLNDLGANIHLEMMELIELPQTDEVFAESDKNSVLTRAFEALAALALAIDALEETRETA